MEAEGKEFPEQKRTHVMQFDNKKERKKHRKNKSKYGGIRRESVEWTVRDGRERWFVECDRNNK